MSGKAVFIDPSMGPCAVIQWGQIYGLLSEVVLVPYIVCVRAAEALARFHE